MSDPNSDKITEESMVRLTQIAELLDCSVSQFFADSKNSQYQGFAEIARLWLSLKTDRQREQVLAYIKNISRMSIDDETSVDT